MSVLIGLLGAYEQWGIIKNDAYTNSWNKPIVFPIKIQIPYIAIASAYDIDQYRDHLGDNGCNIYNLTQSGLTFTYYAAEDSTDKAMYIAIGKG